jgi:LuxR family maltose regulon positive regulatory protein
LINVLALQALVLDAGGTEPAALAKLKEAMVMAERGGDIRSLVDLGAPMADLLRRAMRQSPERAFCHRLLEAFGRESTGPTAGNRPTSGPGELSVGTSYDLDPLTNRELDILELLSQRLQNKEIASHLGISAQTVGTHLKRIYQKLDVHGRRQAIKRGMEMGIIDRHQQR